MPPPSRISGEETGMSATRIGLLLGDPAGVGPEIAAKLLTRSRDRDDLQFFVIGTEAVLSAGARVAEVEIKLPAIRAGAPIPKDAPRQMLLAIDDTDAKEIELGVASRAAGLYALRSLDAAVDAAKAGQIDAIVYAPLNKHAMNLAGFDEIDEMHYLAQKFGCNHFCTELNLLDHLWTARVTSHVPIKDIAANITTKSVIEATRLGVSTMRRAGVANPRVAIAGLNPHAGDGGTIGKEDADVIQPAVEALRKEGLNVNGPSSPDTVFVMAHRGAYDLVVSMYHDQGQIALKSLGFERVVTMLGGLPVPAMTASSGSAYDITGKNKASPDGLISASELARRLVSKAA
jgi:4-hydroxythreonine-4-phosphate dehydrogenase